MLGDEGIEHAAVLEGGVHALAVEGHDGVRRIAEQQHLSAHVPGCGVHGAELALRMGRKLRRQIRQQWQHIGEFAAEELVQGSDAVERCEALRTAARQEQRRGETAVAVRQRDQHEAAARPDVQRVALEPALGQRCAHRELLVVVVEPLIAGHKQARGAEACAHRRPGTVGGDGGRKLALVVRARERIAQLQAVLAQVRAAALLAEAHADAAVTGGLLDEHAIEVGATHRPDDLVLALPVGLERGLAAALMHHAPAHRNQQRLHARHDAGLLECAPAARGEG